MTRSLKALIVRRIILALPVLFGVSVLAFSFTALSPQSPAFARIQSTNPEMIEQLEQQMGLHRPLHAQYIDWLTRFVQGDFGRSLATNQEIRPLLFNRLSVSLQIAFFGFLWMIVISSVLGMISAFNRDKVQDHFARIYSILGISVPDFVVGIFLLFIFAAHLNWLPSGGFVPIEEGILEYLSHIIMPSYTVGFLFAAITTRMFRGDLLDNMNKEHVVAAKAMGISKYNIILQDITKPAIIPTLTTIGMSVSALISGIVITEVVFAIPGIGRLLVDSAFNGDFPVIQASILLVALIFVTLNLVVDLLYYYLDPRIRVGGD